MRIVRPSNADEYLVSLWMRQRRKDGEFPPPEQMKETLLRKFPYKFPFLGAREATWNICEVSTIAELEGLWMHKSGPWLEEHNLWRGSHQLGDLAKTALETGFFSNYRGFSQIVNYNRWKNSGLQGQLDGHEKPMLVQHPDYIDILDGFGRLLPYLALVYEGAEFVPFEAYLAS